MKLMYSSEASTSSATQHVTSHTETHLNSRAVEMAWFRAIHFLIILTCGKMRQFGCFNLMCFVMCGCFGNKRIWLHYVCNMLMYCFVCVYFMVCFVRTSERTTATG